jgi:hypothetical protein
MKSVVTVPEDVTDIFQIYLPIHVAKLWFIDACYRTPLILPQMQDPISLTLHWRSCSRFSRDRFPCFFCNEGGQCYVSDCTWPVTTPDNQRYTTNDHWHSIHTHVQDVVGHVCQFVSIIEVATTLKMDCDIPISLLYHHQLHIWMGP